MMRRRPHAHTHACTRVHVHARTRIRVRVYACLRSAARLAVRVDCARAQVMHEWYPMLIKIFAYYSHVGADVTNNINGIAHSGFVTLLVESGHGVDTAANTVRNRRADPSYHAHHTQCTSSQCVCPCARCHHTERHDVCGAERVFLTWQLSKRYARHAKTLGEDGWDLLWISVNESTLSKSQSQHYNSKQRLTRAEFLEIIVRGATDGQDPTDFAKCCREICEDLIESLCQVCVRNPDRNPDRTPTPPSLAAVPLSPDPDAAAPTQVPHAGLVFHDANKWRKQNIYLPEVCAVLAHHDTTLNNLFKVYAGDVVQAAGSGSSKLMGADEWFTFLRDLGMVAHSRARTHGACLRRLRRIPCAAHRHSRRRAHTARVPRSPRRSRSSGCAARTSRLSTRA